MKPGSRKVCIVTGQYPPQTGGVGHSTQRVAHYLAEHGVVTHVLAFHKCPTSMPADECLVTSQEGPVTVHRAEVWCPDWRRSFEEGGGAIVSEAIVLTRYNREMFDILDRLQRTHRFDLLHAFFLYPAGFIATTIAKYHGVRCVVSIRGNDVGKYMFDPLRRDFVRSALENADHVTSVATNLVKLADRTLCPLDGRATVILNSIDLSKVQVNSKPELPVHGIVIGSAGLFRYKKGLLYLFKALAKLKPQLDFTLLLAGDFFNSEEEKLHRRYLRDLSLEEQTIVTGKLPHKSVFDYYQSLDIAVFPSLFAEGCPLSMLETMAVGRPVIASRTGAIPEVVEDGVSGMLVNPGSSEEIYDALVHLSSDRDWARQLGEQGQRRARELSPEKELRAWMTVYENVLDGTDA